MLHSPQVQQPARGGSARFSCLCVGLAVLLAHVAPTAHVVEHAKAAPVLGQSSKLEHPRLTEAKQLIEALQPESAIQILRPFVTDEANARYFDQAYLLLAAALLRTQAYEEAVVYLDQFVSEFPDSPLIDRARLLLASAHAELGNLDLALPLLAEVRSLAKDLPTRREALALTGELLARKQDYLRAIQAWLEEIRLTAEADQAVPRERIRQVIMERLDTTTLLRVQEAFPRVFPSDLALIRLIELHLARDEQYLAERYLREFPRQFPTHAYVSTAQSLLESFAERLRESEHVIAALLPLSGRLSRFGHDSLRGIRVALERHKDVHQSPSIALAVKDSESDKAFLRSELYDLIDRQRPLAVIGPMRSQEVRNLAELAERTETPFVTPSATLLDVRRLGRYVFSTAVTYSLQATRIADYAMGVKGYYQFCILHPDTSYGRDLARLFSQEVTRRGGQIVELESYAEHATDFGPQIRRLKSQDLLRNGVITKSWTPEGEVQEQYTPGFEAIFIPGTAMDVALIAPQLAFYDIHVPLLGGNGWNTPDLLGLADSSLNGGVFVDGLNVASEDADVVDFVTRYQGRYQTLPSLFAAQAYDAARLVIEAVRLGATSAREVALKLRDGDQLPALGGATRFDARGILNRHLFVLQLKQGKVVDVAPVNGARPQDVGLGSVPEPTTR